MILRAGCIEPDGRILIEQEGQKIIIPAYEIDAFIANLKKHTSSDSEEDDTYFEMEFTYA